MTWQRDPTHEGDQSPPTTRSAGRQGGRGAAARRAKPSGTNVKVETAKAGQAKPELAVQHATKRDHEGYLVKELQHLLRGQIEARMRARGLWLSFPHSAVLMTLSEEPGLSGAQLSRRFSVTAQTMNGLLVPLETKGLIERVPDPENARVLKCYLNRKGVDLMQRGMQEAGAVFEKMLSNLSARERDEFRGILRRCIEALQPRVESRLKKSG
ncbi:MAG TPA: MarR family transcriptional regulator [Steroidobacteraceae bacterium]|nr:MarR family transcriptional regulator [Steroidobacteraceae bacterium]